MDWKNACEVVSAAPLSWPSVLLGTAGIRTVQTLLPFRLSRSPALSS
jgi:hypothetical protein